MKHTITTAGRVSIKLTTKQITALSEDIAHTQDMNLAEASCQNFQFLILQDLSFNKFNKVSYNYKQMHSVTISKAECAALAFRLPIDNCPLSGAIGSDLMEVLREIELLCEEPYQPHKNES